MQEYYAESRKHQHNAMLYISVESEPLVLILIHLVGLPRVGRTLFRKTRITSLISLLSP